MGKLGRLGLEPALRYERARPGELVHIDVKKLGRIQGGAGWRVSGGHQHYNPKYTDKAGKVRHSVGYEYVHIAVDVDCPQFGGQRVVRRLVVVVPLSSSRSRPATGSRASSGV
jgi:hypothetical protein